MSSRRSIGICDTTPSIASRAFLFDHAKTFCAPRARPKIEPPRDMYVSGSTSVSRINPAVAFIARSGSAVVSRSYARMPKSAARYCSSPESPSAKRRNARPMLDSFAFAPSGVSNMAPSPTVSRIRSAPSRPEMPPTVADTPRWKTSPMLSITPRGCVSSAVSNSPVGPMRSSRTARIGTTPVAPRARSN